MLITPVLNQSEIEIIAGLAREIWVEHYVPIIGREQVDYMLDRFQSKAAITAQIESGYLYFLIRDERHPVGYLAVEPRKNELFLSKIYVRASKRGQGLAKKAVEHSEQIARKRGLAKIVLTVNKNNMGSIQAYQKMGFVKTEEIVQDIGSGFVMDDFKMEKTL